MKREIKQQIIITLTKKECEIIMKNVNMKDLGKYNLPIQTKILFIYINDFIKNGK